MILCDNESVVYGYLISVHKRSRLDVYSDVQCVYS